MITPNFERLAAKSVVFDQAYAQIAVCNPSRDSLLTGLRPDTIGVYGFQTSFRPHRILPTQLARSGFNTAGYGKILHWESNDRDIWNYDSWENGWYDYQNIERDHMNSSTLPDRYKPEEDFRDYQFTTRTIEAIRKLSVLPKPYMVALGFKLPHLAVHIPYKYYEMYKGKSESWTLTKKELRFPPSAPSLGYRCCPEPVFHHMHNEGTEKAVKSVQLGDINFIFTEKMHDELMLGYCAAVTFVDKQLGRILDVIDELSLWNNLTIVLTADHGMHNGEKGMWEKWTLYDESTRVPLLISHPLSPYKGHHYPYPVELIDVYPTVLDLVYRKNRNECGEGLICPALQGKSLAPIIFGTHMNPSTTTENKKKSNSYFHFSKDKAIEPTVKSDNIIFTNISGNIVSVINQPLDQVFAISQSLRCANKLKVIEESTNIKNSIPNQTKLIRKAIWYDCDLNRANNDEISVLGYSYRTLEYRYNAWFHFNRVKHVPITDVPPFIEELYDHRNETPDDFTHLEIVNLVHKGGYENIVLHYREKLIEFIKKKVVFRKAQS